MAALAARGKTIWIVKRTNMDGKKMIFMNLWGLKPPVSPKGRAPVA